MVVVQALLGPAAQAQFLGLAVGVDRIRPARLDGAEDGNQTLADAVAGGDLAGEVFLAFAVVEVEQGPGGVTCGLLDAAAEAVGGVAGVGLEVLEEDLLLPEEVEETA